MRLVSRTILAVTLAALSTSAVAQTTSMVLRQGTPVAFATRSELDPMSAKPGDRFEMVLTEHLKVDGVVVVPAGAVGIGEVVAVSQRGGFGRAGEVRTRPVSIDYWGHHIDLDTAPNDDKPTRTKGAGASFYGVPHTRTYLRTRQANGSYTSTRIGGLSDGTLAATAAASILATVLVAALTKGPDGKIAAAAPMRARVRSDTPIAAAGTPPLPRAAYAATPAAPNPDGQATPGFGSDIALQAAQAIAI